MTKENFLTLLLNAKDNLACDCQKDKYQAWTSIRNISKLLEFIDNLEIGLKEIRADVNIKNHSTELSYWTTTAKIVLESYPYAGADIYRCQFCQSIFLFYTEYAGHYCENRLRWVQAHLLE